MSNVTLLPAAYDAQRQATLTTAILRLHGVIAQAPDNEAQVLAARDAAGQMAAILLTYAQRGRGFDARAAEALPHILDALGSLVAVRAIYEREAA